MAAPKAPLLDKAGKKMSKSRDNAVDPDSILKNVESIEIEPTIEAIIRELPDLVGT